MIAYHHYCGTEFSAKVAQEEKPLGYVRESVNLFLELKAVLVKVRYCDRFLLQLTHK